MQDRLKKEMASPHADVGCLSRLRRSQNLARARRAAETRRCDPSQNAGGYSIGQAGNGNGGAPAEATTSFAVPGLATMEVQAGCKFCGGTLPEGRTVVYCPHCGQNLAAKHLRRVRVELDPIWKFCINCGKRACASIAQLSAKATEQVVS